MDKPTPKISVKKEQRLKAILADLEKHMKDIDKMKKKLKLKKTSFFSGKDSPVLEEITVPPLELLKKKK